MNYAEQRRYLEQNRIYVVIVLFVWMVLAALCLKSSTASTRAIIGFVLVVVAIGFSVAYTPDYLHLTVNPRKRLSWEIKIRWRIAAAALVIGLLSVSSLREVIVVVAATAWVAVTNLVARSIVASRHAAAYFWLTDLAFMAVLMLSRLCDPLVGVALLAGAAHLSVVICERRVLLWSFVVAISAWLLLALLRLKFPLAPDFFFTTTCFVSVSALTTGWLVHRAQERNSRNVEAAMQELMEFSGYPEEKVRRLWSESDKELARNWVSADLDESDSQAMADWYKQNSELYMFAISGYNLDYKRIRSNLKVLQFGRGACLDYGAGNGEVILELARRGHPAAYYDVDGVSASFAKWRSKRRGLDVKFFHSKEPLAAAANQRRFDTVFSLDVLEHLPDLPGELTFLASLLNTGGMLVFDVPAGTTKSHPMHLNHHVEVRSLLKAKGMTEQRSGIYKLPFVKQEKYVFVAG